MNIQIKSYTELSKDELYRVLQLRSEVFVVEQDCAYLDPDGLDQKAFHVMGSNQAGICAYTRIFRAGDYFDKPSIGRVLVSKNERGNSYGKEIMEASLEFIETKLKSNEILISAQLYLKEFYEELGFKKVGEGYLEDGIPHIKMKRKR